MSRRRPHRKWDGRVSALASLTVSGIWHLLVLSVLVLAVHPFQLPMQDAPPIELQLLPRLPDLIPRPPAPKPKPQPSRLPTLRPEEPPLERVNPQDQTLEPPIDIAKPKAPTTVLQQRANRQEDVLDKPAEVNRQPQTARQKLDTARNRLDLPPAPLDETRPNQQALSKPPEVLRTAPERPPVLDLRRLPPSLPVEEAKAPAQAPAPAAEAPIATAPGQTPVLTNQQVVASPVEIRARERTAAPVLGGAQPGAEQIPQAAGAGAPPAGGGAASGGGGVPGELPGGPRTGPNGSVLRNFDTSGLQNGMRMRLGCESPDTYKLTQEERAACLDRLAKGAQGVGDLGLNIPSDKQAAYDHYVACQDAYHRSSIPSSHGDSAGTSVRGMGDNPTLKACGPSTR